jgi:hypothetical protein
MLSELSVSCYVNNARCSIILKTAEPSKSYRPPSFEDQSRVELGSLIFLGEGLLSPKEAFKQK